MAGRIPGSRRADQKYKKGDKLAFNLYPEGEVIGEVYDAAICELGPTGVIVRLTDGRFVQIDEDKARLLNNGC